ncbi:hypothetical protein FHL15_001944 [Xylaria flabelliformis]|uniref:Uncharacterized protein n=1 Tax=Xylaria flabelliformis TaxID=2512241 RepID=A0A553IAC0_9PEZI|nr:hypothetical protein FHL15_001944 [Xylaria flabelliformis]
MLETAHTIVREAKQGKVVSGHYRTATLERGRGLKSDRGGRSIDPGGLNAEVVVQQVILVCFGRSDCEDCKTGLSLRRIRSLDLVDAKPRGSQWNNRTAGELKNPFRKMSERPGSQIAIVGLPVADGSNKGKGMQEIPLPLPQD